MMLAKKQPNLSNIMVYIPTCTVHLHTDNKPLRVRGNAAIMIVRNDDLKRYHV